MRPKRTVACIAVAALAPMFLGAVSVAAGHVLWSHIDQPTLVKVYCDFRLDRVIVGVNAALCAGVVATVVFLFPIRRNLAAVLALLSSIASLPAYSLAYHSSIHVAQWLGLGWAGRRRLDWRMPRKECVVNSRRESRRTLSALRLTLRYGQVVSTRIVETQTSEVP